jgi:hypothetical protein
MTKTSAGALSWRGEQTQHTRGRCPGQASRQPHAMCHNLDATVAAAEPTRSNNSCPKRTPSILVACLCWDWQADHRHGRHGPTKTLPTTPYTHAYVQVCVHGRPSTADGTWHQHAPSTGTWHTCMEAGACPCQANTPQTHNENSCELRSMTPLATRDVTPLLVCQQGAAQHAAGAHLAWSAAPSHQGMLLTVWVLVRGCRSTEQ